MKKLKNKAELVTHALRVGAVYAKSAAWRNLRQPIPQKT